MTVETFELLEPIPGSVAEAIQHEADAMADLRGSTVAEVRISSRT